MRHSRRLVLAAAGLGLAAATAPSLPSAQADHCQALLIFSGYSVQVPVTVPPSPAPTPVPVPAAPAGASQSINPGAGGCANDDEATNTNLLMPGANFLSVGSYPTPVEGWIDVDGVVTPLTFTQAADKSRFNSQKVTLNNAKAATATVKTITGLTVSVTYTATPSTEL